MVNSTIPYRVQFVKATILSCLTISEARLVARISSGGLGHVDCKHISVKNACLYENNGGQPSMVLVCKHRSPSHHNSKCGNKGIYPLIYSLVMRFIGKKDKKDWKD